MATICSLLDPDTTVVVQMPEDDRPDDLDPARGIIANALVSVLISTPIVLAFVV